MNITDTNFMAMIVVLVALQALFLWGLFAKYVDLAEGALVRICDTLESLVSPRAAESEQGEEEMPEEYHTTNIGFHSVE